jgi:neutral ceramidase
MPVRKRKRLDNMRRSFLRWVCRLAVSFPIGVDAADNARAPRETSPQAVSPSSPAEFLPSFLAGVAQSDITPEKPMPMWGYGARHARLSEGVLDRLQAKAIVIQAGAAKLAIVGVDLGRGPTPRMMDRIRQAVAPQGINHVLICGSHTHHGPVIELTDQPGFGKGEFDSAVAYAKELPAHLITAIQEADRKRQPARIGIAWRDVSLNRNRHSKRPVKPTDPRLTVIRFDHLDGSPIAVLVHYAAHPVLTAPNLLSFSADYPGFVQARVEQEIKAPCVFIQGAAGDLSPNPENDRPAPQAFGEALAHHVTELARNMATTSPQQPSLAAAMDRFHFTTRIQLKSSITFLVYARSFFPELVRNFVSEFTDGMNAELTTVLLNGDLAIVGVPGELFCQHATRLRERARFPAVLVFGYCNGHLLYLPTIEAAAEGGYGADPPVSPIALGAGEAMMDRALINIYRLQGKFPGEHGGAVQDNQGTAPPAPSSGTPR